MAVRQLARKHVRQQLAGDELHGATIDVVTRGALARATRSSTAPCGATGCAASRTSTRCRRRGRRCGCHDATPAPAQTPAPAAPDVRAEMLKGAQILAAPAPTLQAPGASPPTSRSTRRCSCTRPAGSRSTWCAASSWSRSPPGCGTGGRARSRSPRTRTTPRSTRRPSSSASECAKVHGHGVVGVRVEVAVRTPPHRRRAGRHGGPARGRAQDPGASTPPWRCPSCRTSRPATSRCSSAPAGCPSASPSAPASSTPRAARPAPP